MSASMPTGFRVVYARPKFGRSGDAWYRVAECRYAASQIESMANAGDKRVWRGLDGSLSVLAISPALEAR